MTILHDILTTHKHNRHATETGTKTHARLQHIYIDGAHSTGDADLVAKIVANPKIAQLFTPASQTEVPIAGTINGNFISRRIDRLLIDNKTQTIHIMDYKTDINPNDFRNKYVTQITEYSTLLHQLYPNYKIYGYILWTRNFSLEKLAIKSL